jgi:thiosulfate/3-mercaptopyruvate sulfurtransferase
MRATVTRLLAVICLLSSASSSPLAAQASQPARISPADMVKAIQLPAAQRPLAIQIGFRIMYQQAHIPGSEFIGPGSDASAIEQLRKRVQPLARDKFIVLYCGCCPWDRCPNVAPAAKALAAMGFTNVKLLYIPTDFGTDWAAKGYPVEKGR